MKKFVLVSFLTPMGQWVKNNHFDPCIYGSIKAQGSNLTLLAWFKRVKLLIYYQLDRVKKVNLTPVSWFWWGQKTGVNLVCIYIPN